jgi:hypothetical protein
VDLGVAAIPLGVGLLSRAFYHAEWSLAFMAVFSVPLYWGAATRSGSCWSSSRPGWCR